MTGRLFHDLASFVAAPRIAGLELSPDGQRLVVSVQTLDAKRTAYVGSLWELDPRGEQEPTRLTRGATSDSIAGFTSDGDVLFTAKRPVPPPLDDSDSDNDSDNDAATVAPMGSRRAATMIRPHCGSCLVPVRRAAS